MTGKSPSVWATFAGLLLFLLYYSQTNAYAWDEGFHLLTAQLIAHGKTPYFDFFFPQTPLNAYWNAFWMRLFGDTWRTAHAVAAVMTCITVLLTGGFVLRRTANSTAAVVAMLLFGLNSMVVQFGPVGQAYGFCLCMVVIAFRLVVKASEETGFIAAFGAGLFAAASASASLLTAPVAPVMWLWMILASQAGARLRNAAAFACGCVVGTAPVWWMMLQDPKRILFDMFLYNMRYRAVNWDDVGSHDITALLAGIDNAQALVLGLGAVGTVIFLLRNNSWHPGNRAPLYLCAALAGLLGIHIANGRPTFERYFLFLVPWLAILIGFGLAAVPGQYRKAVAGVLLTLTFLGLGKSLYEERDSFTWGIWEEVSKKVLEVTPPGRRIQADEHVYLVTRRVPPEGMEHENSHKALPLTAEERRSLHIVSKPELEKQVRDGYYSTIATCDDDKPVSKDIVAPRYANKWELEQCTVYWGFQQPGR